MFMVLWASIAKNSCKVNCEKNEADFDFHFPG